MKPIRLARQGDEAKEVHYIAVENIKTGDIVVVANSMNELSAINKCNCYRILGRPQESMVVHLTGCEEDGRTKEYDALKWWQKLFRSNPRNLL